MLVASDKASSSGGESSHRRAVTARPASATLCDAPRAAGHHGPITRLVLAGNPSFCDLARDGRWRDFDGDADDCPPLRNDLSALSQVHAERRAYYTYREVPGPAEAFADEFPSNGA
jgi:hypothetical protein